MGDFEALFDLDIFNDEIEKIKTIGETFMAASGLNLKVRLTIHLQFLGCQLPFFMGGDLWSNSAWQNA